MTILRRTKSRRGVALLMVTMLLGFVAIVGTDISLSGEVRIQRAAHQRDELQAESLARSGINFYRLILVANKQLGENSQMASGAAMLGINLGDALWQWLPTINSSLLRMLMVMDGSVDEEDVERLATDGLTAEERQASRDEGVSMFSDSNFLDFEGDFIAQITDEDSRISIVGLSAAQEGSIMENPTAIQLFGLMSGEENDQWFYQQNIDRWEIIANLKDWMDRDTDRSGSLGGYEDNVYNSLESPYLTKNAPFDTKEEIRLVEGWQDAVFERFGDSITIYGAGLINVNTASDEVLTGLLKAYVTPSPSDYQCELILVQMKEYALLTQFTNGEDFITWLSGQGLTVGETLGTVIGTNSNVFTVQSMGIVGDSTTTITAVMDFSTESEGRIAYWRNE
jgi:type II secretory pathway component PulK